MWRERDACSTPSMHPDKACGAEARDPCEPCPNRRFICKSKDCFCFGVICYKAMDNQNVCQINPYHRVGSRGTQPRLVVSVK